MVVVHGIRNACQSAGEERGVADEGDVLLGRVGGREALRHGDSRAHAKAGVDGVERVGVAQRVASYVAAEDGVVARHADLRQGALHGIEAAAVRASRAEHGMPWWKFLAVLVQGRRPQHALDHFGIGLALLYGRASGLEGAFVVRLFRRPAAFGSRAAVAMAALVEEARDAHGDVFRGVLAARGGVARELAVYGWRKEAVPRDLQQFLLDDGVELLEDDDVRQPLEEAREYAARSRVRRAYLHELVVGHGKPRALGFLAQKRQRLKRVAGGVAACHDSQPGRRRHGAVVHDAFHLPAVQEHRVEACELLVVAESVGDLVEAFQDLAVGLVGAPWEDDPSVGVAHEALRAVGHVAGDVAHAERRPCLRLALDVEERGRVADAGGGAHDDRRSVVLGQVEGRLHHEIALLGVGRVEHRNLGERREAPRVLLGLRRYGARVVGDEQHEAAAHAHVVERHEGVGRHIQAHLLAGEERAHAGH